jgi:molybdopterin-guanine dinucleotide biosynthesis protein A
MFRNEMLKLDGMLMIGSVGINAGKTVLACEVIKKFYKSINITGIKVTTIKAKDGTCPRGGRGCGVCSSLDGNFCITEELERDSGKDTSRLLAAGAHRVFWLRVMRSHLQEGITALLNIMGSNTISVCESNSLRRVVEPGLFLMVTSTNLKKWKASAKDVRKYVDKIVASNGSSFDFDIAEIKLTHLRWQCDTSATAIILAGGKSSRIGSDKAKLTINGQTMLEHICKQLFGTFSQVLISTAEIEKYSFSGFEVVLDKTPGQGPLMGIASALEASSNEINFVVACDIPYMEMSCVRRMLAEARGADIVVPITGNKKLEPLFAVYRKSALDAINQTLREGKRKISEVFEKCDVKYIDLGEADWLININTLAEFEEFKKSKAIKTAKKTISNNQFIIDNLNNKAKKSIWPGS